MQSCSLTVDKFLGHSAKWAGAVEVVTGETGEATRRLGYAELHGRSRSGGGWINPVARAHPRWGERPILAAEPHRDVRFDEPAVVDALRGRVADWWLPDEVIVLRQMPLAPTGKIDKVKLRTEYGAARS